MPLTKAKITDISSPDAEQAQAIEVLFNPTEYRITSNLSYAEVAVPGLQVPLLQFVRGEAELLDVTLFLDRSDRRPPDNAVSNADLGLFDDLERLRNFTRIVGELHAPPIVEFSWGTTSFQGVVTQYNEQYTMFDEDGNILRARVALQLKRFTPAEIQRRETDPQSPDRTKTRVLREGERLDHIAAEEYGDPSLWHVIASHNRIARPRFVAPGTVLTIPPL